MHENVFSPIQSLPVFKAKHTGFSGTATVEILKQIVVSDEIFTIFRPIVNPKINTSSRLQQLVLVAYFLSFVEAFSPDFSHH